MSNNKASASDRITSKEAEISLLKSGYLLESRVEQSLEEHGYNVEANSVYPDAITNKTREFDLYASTIHSLNGRFTWVSSVMLVECINNLQPIAFITKEPHSPESFRYDIKLVGLPTRIIQDKETWLSVVDLLGTSQYHHYCSGRIATQFCSFVKKKNSEEWMAFHEDSHFESFQKLCDVTNYHINNVLDNLYPRNSESVNFQFCYPLIVTQGDLIDVRPHKNKGVDLHSVQHVHFVKTLMQNKQPETHHIDVITEDYLPQYVDIINSEMTETMKGIKKNIEVMNKSIDEIVIEFNKAETQDAKRAILSF